MQRLFIIAGLVCAACGDPWIERDTQVVYTPTNTAATLSVTGQIVTSHFPTDVSSTMRNDSAILVIDLDADSATYRQLQGIEATYDADALTVSTSFAPEPCLNGSFGFVLINSIRDTDGDRVGRARAFDDAFELRDDDDSNGVFRPLRSALVDVGVDLGGVAGATLFAVAECP